MYVGGGGGSTGAAGGNFDTTGSTVVLHLELGDDVSVQNMDVNEAVHGDMYSLFTGYLLKASEDETAFIVGK